ncbi:MAG: hypothetical protein WCJ54_06240, partial [Actinomycetota bacterium]
ENFNIEMKIQNKNLSYLHPDKEKYCRGDKLGGAYTKEGINSEFEKRLHMRMSKSPAFAGIVSGIERITQKIAKDIEKESIRAQKKNTPKLIPKEREKQKSYERER